jgi:hypothetical protein
MITEEEEAPAKDLVGQIRQDLQERPMNQVNY